MKISDLCFYVDGHTETAVLTSYMLSIVMIQCHLSCLDIYLDAHRSVNIALNAGKQTKKAR